MSLLLAVCLAAGAQNRVIIKVTADTPDEIVSAVKAFEKADLLFTMERQVRKDDTPEMKSALAMVQWKNNELVESVPSLPSVDVVDASPESVAGVIERALAEKWMVRTPGVWRKLLRDEARTHGGRRFYVAACGNDDADGLSPETAWHSLSRVNDADLGFADTVCFRAGDVFRGHLEPQSGSHGQSIVYMSYGKGRKPVLEPSWDASSPQDWEKVGDMLWKCEKPSVGELGNVILNHGKRGCAFKVDSPELLNGKDLHFCWVRDDAAVYMVSRTNPGKRFRSVELAEKQHIIDETDCHDIVYDGLWLRYGAAHGIGGSGVSRIVIRNCDISWIGGSTLYYDEGGRGVRYGNGIEFWSAAQDILVENCRVWECWDAALTNQSNIDGVVQKNITWRGNKIWNCEYSYEYWQQGDGARTRNILFEGNDCRNAGYGWGHKQRWNPNAAHLMFYDTTADTDGFVVKGNRFIRSKNCGMRLFNAWYDSLTMEDNLWRIPWHPLCRYHARPTSGLVYKYPDRLDRAHSDSREEIESQTVEEPRVFGPGRRDMRSFNEMFNHGKVYELVVEMLPGECWWGAFDNPFAWQITEAGGNYSFPFDASMKFSCDFRDNTYGNNCVPFLVSSAGRYVWSDEPFAFSLKDGVLRFEGPGAIEVEQAGKTLREAYLAASAAHFPPSGTMPPEAFIARPQYNTWIELTYNQNQADILRYASDIVKNGFPVDAVFMVDDNWQKYYGNFEFKPERFPDPKGMITKLHSMGFKVMFWLSPYVSPDSPEYRELEKKGYFAMDPVADRPAILKWWNGWSAMLDMSNPDARQWLVDKLRGMQRDYGVDGFKFDAGDAANYSPEKIRVFDGKSYGPRHTELWCRMYEDFPYNELRASWKLAGQPIVMRLCDKKYAWSAVESLVPSMINASMEGHIYVCPDMIGGGEFTSFLDIDIDDIDQEQIVRSCQIHAMMPMMQFSVAPWRILSKENLAICRDAAWRHARLGPYLVEQARRGSVSGEPVVRPMDYAFPGEGFESCSDQYMLGPDYLVAPMLAPGTSRSVRLPAGRWKDECGQEYEGGREYTIEVPLSRIPVFELVAGNL